ncbi:MAG: CvpA family protein [Bacteroidales bacterium]|jgi:membrane protein required for colicin V production|nr:CvpA family protein [Bacteroidales bacterium]HHT52358.1 CvpA family protein [Bacteroidales bacterium]
MNYLDFLIVIPLLWFGYKGFTNGLVRELASILALVGGLFVAFRFSDWVAEKIQIDSIPSSLYFVITFFGVLILTYLAGAFVEKIVKVVIPPIINQILGALFGAAKVLTIVSALLFIVNSLDTKEVLIKPKTKVESFFYPYTEPIIPKLQAFFNKEEEEKPSEN